MAMLREQIAVQKAKEKELNRTIHITGISVTSMLNINLQSSCIRL